MGKLNKSFYKNMSFDAYVRIDLQDAFDDLRTFEKIDFIKYNLDVLDDDYLFEYLRDKGYDISNEDE